MPWAPRSASTIATRSTIGAAARGGGAHAAHAIAMANKLRTERSLLDLLLVGRSRCGRGRGRFRLRSGRRRGLFGSLVLLREVGHVHVLRHVLLLGLDAGVDADHHD